MNSTITLEAPAKINIGLHVLSKRKDNYHNIETIFYPVKLSDKITVKISSHSGTGAIINFTTNGRLINNNDNLCVKAVSLFLQEFNIQESFKIYMRLCKKIPIGAGLGGGSSDAAAVLKILSGAFGLDENQKKKLDKVALKIGSDVPYFLLGNAAYASSRGEKLIPLPDFKIDNAILIVNPGIHVSTPLAYKMLGIKNEKPKTLNTIKVYSEKYIDKFTNDFEKVVFKKHPEIRIIKEEMKKFGAVYS
ncbi:MAG: 4-(cytidine 5'-diphospho)-2-C-methyl-D-erythritol kinase, partial [Ignavibacteriae bacterium]